MRRRRHAALALAVLLLRPPAAAFAQLRISGVLQGTLTLLPSPAPSLSLGAAPTALPIAVAHRYHVISRPTRIAYALHLSVGPILPSVTAIVTPTRVTVFVWAPEAQRVELRVENDGESPRSIECLRSADH